MVPLAATAPGGLAAAGLPGTAGADPAALHRVAAHQVARRDLPAELGGRTAGFGGERTGAAQAAPRDRRHVRHGHADVLLRCWPARPRCAATFQAARNDEYEEIVDKCEDFLRQVQKEYDENHFTYAELEENEVDLVKLKNWFAKIVERDVFGASGRAACEQSLDRCEQSLETYAAPGLRRGGGGTVSPEAISLMRPHLLSRMPYPRPPGRPARQGTTIPC